MINFKNNWQTVLTEVLLADAGSLDVGLPQGRYRLTLADSLAPDAERELVSAFVDAAGVATLVRGVEFSTAREWPVGSIIYGSITAEVLVGVFKELQSLRDRVAALDSRPNVQHLEIEFSPESWSAPGYFDAPFIRSLVVTPSGGSPEAIPIDELTFADGSAVPYQPDWLGSPAAMLFSERSFAISLNPYWLTAGATLAVVIGGIASFDGALRVRSNNAPEIATAERSFLRSATDLTVTLTAAA